MFSDRTTQEWHATVGTLSPSARAALADADRAAANKTASEFALGLGLGRLRRLGYSIILPIHSRLYGESLLRTQIIVTNGSVYTLT